MLFLCCLFMFCCLYDVVLWYFVVVLPMFGCCLVDVFVVLVMFCCCLVDVFWLFCCCLFVVLLMFLCCLCDVIFVVILMSSSSSLLLLLLWRSSASAVWTVTTLWLQIMGDSWKRQEIFLFWALQSIGTEFVPRGKTAESWTWPISSNYCGG
jgi:hypothetical protein